MISSNIYGYKADDHMKSKKFPERYENLNYTFMKSWACEEDIKKYFVEGLEDCG